ncbi:LysR substrate-binding domain-containing protein [Shinella curvata]|uniref:LysR substrate-binding domain-containing protein n=1 Tax=Shinella curvata TaxID=1817964 RepID=A0ABT8XMW2_9HYPH|nr:LysR substrate-binding domain-containing protein [Shinella curvata]MCJ8056624.1 LysR substrate-binding domain-containing protein [Shinella curvata]MDO6124536.1 LysR substrate-binding domain-containing protein [Shinella curvata]
MLKFRHIPPTQFMKGFEAAARLESFSRAAEEIGVTQSAISHQMRLLEGQIGQPLFLRVGREVRLTDAGRDYHRTVRRCLEMMEEGYRRLEPYRKPGSVVIYAPRDLARRWFLPRLTALKLAVPACEPWLDTSGAAIDFETMEVDIAIIYAHEPPPGSESILIARNSLAPVAATALARVLSKPADLLTMPLIHEEGPIGWADWLADREIAPGSVWRGANFSDSDIALAAAELGQGVALASIFLAQDALATGSLVQPFPAVLDTGRGWYAVSSPERLNDNDVGAVWEWLKAETVGRREQTVGGQG